MPPKASLKLRRPPSGKDVETFVASAAHNDNQAAKPTAPAPDPFEVLLGTELAAKVTTYCKHRGLDPRFFLQQAVRRFLEAQDIIPVRLTRFLVRKLRVAVARYVWA